MFVWTVAIEPLYHNPSLKWITRHSGSMKEDDIVSQLSCWHKPQPMYVAAEMSKCGVHGGVYALIPIRVMALAKYV
jgi:hypothetical protein